MFRFDYKLNERDRLLHDLKKWARGLFLKDWTLKLLALGIALVLWYGVTGQRAPVTERIPGVHLTFRLPGNLVMSNTPRNDVDLTVTGAHQTLDRLSGRELEVIVNLTDYGPGDHTLLLNSDKVKITLPEGVALNRVEPNTVKVRLEVSVERELPVMVQTNGTPPEGREFYGVHTQPAMVRVIGPASRVNGLQRVDSEPVTLTGRSEGFEIERLRLALPDEQVDLAEALVKATFDIGEKRLERAVEGVAVRAPEGFKPEPEKVSVVIFGPRSVVEQVKPEDLEVALSNQNGAIPTPSLKILRQDWANALQLRAFRPAIFSLIK
jgi:YbbR domain-containing protein